MRELIFGIFIDNAEQINKLAKLWWNFSEGLKLVFSNELCKIFKNTFLTEHLWTIVSAFLFQVIWNWTIWKEDKCDMSFNRKFGECL